MKVLPPTAEGLRAAVGWLEASRPVGMPTETVYGLAAPFDDVRAVSAVYEAKGRPHFDPLIVHVADPDQLADVAVLEMFSATERSRIRQLVDEYWPGPLTLVLPKHPVVPDLVTSGHATVAVRCPDHPVARALIRQLGRPVVAPSANLFGQVSPTTAAHVVEELGDRVVAVLDGGACSVGVESTILQFKPGLPPALLRPGGLPIVGLREALGPIALPGEGEPVVAPGQLEHHYAPATPMSLWSEPLHALPDRTLLERLGEEERPVALVVFEDRSDEQRQRVARVLGEHVRVVPLSLDGSWVSLAQRLFATVRDLDRSVCTRIIVEALPHDHGLAPAVHDRLTRAARGRV